MAVGLFEDPDLARTTVYFTSYYFETCRLLGRIDRLFERMGFWFDLEKQGFRTVLESPEPSRSDCHAWGAHPLYHCFATIMGIRPAGMGGNDFVIEPGLGPLQWAKCRFAHPKGDLHLDLRREGKALACRVTMPAGVSGSVFHGGRQRILAAGGQEFTL